MNHSLLPSFKKAVCILPFFACLLFSSQLLAQKNAPVAGDAAMLTDLLKKDYNTLDPDARREQLAKDRTIVIGTLKRYLTDEQQINIKSNPNEKVESCFMEYKKAEQELTLYNTKVSKGEAEINKINQLITDSEGNKKEYYEKRYTSDIASFKKLIDVFKTENQYLCYVSDAFHTKYEALQQFQDDQYAEASQESSIQKALPFIGGDLAFEVIIDGLSKFLAERIKEELTVAVIERVQDYLRNPKENDPLAELKVLLPRTQQYLLSFKASQMVNFPDEIKQYIEDDLKHLPENLGDLGNTPRIQRLVKEYPELDFALEALEFIPNLSKIKNPVDFFDLLENSRNISRWAQDETKPVQFNLANTLKLSSLLAHSLTVVDNGELRIAGADFLNAYGSEVPFYLMYVGFLHQQNTKYFHIEFKSLKSITLCTIDANGTVSPQTKNRILLSDCTKGLMKKVQPADLDGLKENIDFFEYLFSGIGSKAEKIYVSTQMIRKARKNGTDIGADTIYTYIDDIISLTEEVSGTADTLISFLLNHSEPYLCTETKLDCFDYNSIESWEKRGKVFIHSRKAVNDYFGLEDRISPYLAIARKTNELIYDLQQKKYATAIIKALEITADLWPYDTKHQPVYLKQTLTLLPHKGFSTGEFNWRKELRKEWHAKSWSKVLMVEEINHRFAKIILQEIKNIKDYYKYNYFDQKKELLEELSNIYLALNFSEKNKKITKIDCSNELRTLILSYYLETSLTDYDSFLVDELKQFTINESGKQRPLFLTSIDRIKFINTFHTYYLSYFQYLLDNNKESLKNANETFRKEVENLLFKIPENHSFQLNPQTIQIIHFINDMAKAENSDDVKDAIQAFALPAGSYSLKRQQKFTFSVNSYPGIMGSFETTWKNKTAYLTGTPSFTAPVGLNFCWGAPRGMSHSLFVPVIDVGAFTRMYLFSSKIDPADSDSTEMTKLPEFSFMNLFSPGAYYALGFRKTPLSLYAGFQWGPYLREVKKEEGEIKTVNNYNSMRFSIGLVLDIPLWNIHSKSRL